MKYIDLFAGVGGFHYGIENASEGGRQRQEFLESNRLVSSSSGKRPKQSSFTCVYSNEWDKYANSVYKKQFGECDATDITKVKAKDIPDHDLLCGGFPCQAFSVAGKRGGFNDTRGTLFFEIARIAAEKRPRHLLLENVKGLLSHQRGETFQTMLRVLSDLGYRVEWQVLNSKHFGVPQNRERVFIIGHLRDRGGRKVFPIGRSGQEVESTNHPALDANYYKGYSNQRRMIRQPLRYLNRNQKNIEGDYAFTVDASQTSGVKTGTRIRRLTPVECERLQGFPDNWTKYGYDGKEISDTQRYKMMGNAVTTNVISAIIRRLHEN